jgi:tetratricopeptide (TPR) repeat protein
VKPLGTITMCFPHVDEDTRSILQSVMDKAENYADFTKRLCEKACSEKVTPVLQYFAFFHAYNMDMYKQMERLFHMDEKPPFIEPLYLANELILGYEVDMKAMLKSLVSSMETIPNDWLACHLYLQWRLAAETFDPETDTDVQSMNTLRERIENDMDFECFQPLMFGLDAYGFMLKGYHEDAIKLYKKGLALARKHDDLALVANGLYFLAESVKNYDESAAMDLMLEQDKIAEELGYTLGLARTSLVRGRIMAYRGEYDAALNHYLEYCEMTESIGHPAALTNFSLLLLYNLMKNEEKALEYLASMKGKIDGRKRHLALYHMHLAFVFMNVGNDAKAHTQLDTAKHLAIQSGIQGFLNLHQLLEGIFEKEQGDYQSATVTLETLMNRLGEGDHLRRNLCLFHLADIEVETCLYEQVELSESWLNRFEAYTMEKDFPGFAAQAKILRAKLFQEHGENEKSLALVKEVLRAAESPSMMYLKEMLVMHIPELSSRSRL